MTRLALVFVALALVVVGAGKVAATVWALPYCVAVCVGGLALLRVTR